MSFKEIKALIKSGRVSAALELIKDVNDDKLAFKLFNEVYFLCQFSSDSIQSTVSVVDDLYELTSNLCLQITLGRKYNVANFTKTLYFIVRFFMEKNRVYAKKLGEYFVSLSDFVGEAESTVDGTIADAVIFEFIKMISENDMAIFKSADKEDTIAPWIDFLLRLYQAYRFKKLSKFLVILRKILIDVQNNYKESLNDTASLFMSKLACCISSFAQQSLTSSMPANEKDFINLALFLKYYFLYVNATEVSKMTDDILNFLNGLKRVWSCYRDDLELVASCFDTCTAIQNKKNYIRRFESFFQAFASANKNPNALSLVLVILLHFQSMLVSTSELMEMKIGNWSEFCAQCFRRFMKQDSTRCEAYELITFTFTIISRSSLSKQALLAIYPTAKMILASLDSFIKDEDCKKQRYFACAVAEMINSLNVYNKVEMYHEASVLWRYILPVFSKIDPETLWTNSTLKRYISFWLKVITPASAHEYGADAQATLLVFISFHPKFTDAAMASWVSIKLSKNQTVHLEATVVDLLDMYGDDLVKRYPNVKSLNVNQLLLSEVRSYSKSRDQFNKAVLAVYKSAAKVVKDNIYLANILCCTIDAFCLNVDGNIYLSSLEKSLDNLIAHFRKFEHGKTVDDLPVLLCTLGNLFYMKARLELHRIRKKSEEEELEKEKCEASSKIIILREGAKDDLDITEVAIMQSPIKLSKQPKIFRFLEEAMNYWSESESLLTPHTSIVSTLAYIKNTAYLYRLYGDRNKDSLCWNLLYRIAGKLESEESQVLAVAELLTHREKVDPSFIGNVESFLSSVKQNSQKRYVYYLYLVNTAKNFYFNGKVEESRKALERIESPSILPTLIKIQYNTMMVLLNSVSGGIPTNGTPLYAPLIKAAGNLQYIVKLGKYESFNEATVVQLLIIEVSLLIIVFCADASSVRMARCYIRSHISLGRRLAIPVRICEFTSLQCWVDLLTWDTVDTDLSAKELEKMLEMTALKEDGQLQTTPLKYGSPKLSSHIRCYPHFLTKSGCDCLYCRDVHCQILTLSSIMIRAKILIANGFNYDAKNVLNIGLSVVEVINDKGNHDSNLWTLLFSPIARFYHLVANCKFLWKKYNDALHYANLARNILLGQTTKNTTLLGSIDRILFSIEWIEKHTQQPVLRPAPTLSVTTKMQNAVLGTPETEKSGKTSIFDAPAKPTIGTANRRYLDSGKKRPTKPLTFEKQGLSPNQSNNINVPRPLPLIVFTPPPEGKTINGNTTVKKYLPSRKNISNTPDKENDCKMNREFFNTPGIAQKTINGVTPQMKIFYDPEGLESNSTTSKKPKAKRDLKLSSTAKRPAKSATSRTAKSEKLGTPLASKLPHTRKLFTKMVDSSNLDIVTPRNGKTKPANMLIDETPRSTESAQDCQNQDGFVNETQAVEEGFFEQPAQLLEGISIPTVGKNKLTGRRGQNKKLYMAPLVEPSNMQPPLRKAADVATISEHVSATSGSDSTLDETKIVHSLTALKKVRARRNVLNGSDYSHDCIGVQNGSAGDGEKIELSSVSTRYSDPVDVKEGTDMQKCLPEPGAVPSTSQVSNDSDASIIKIGETPARVKTGRGFTSAHKRVLNRRNILDESSKDSIADIQDASDRTHIADETVEKIEPSKLNAGTPNGKVAKKCELSLRKNRTRNALVKKDELLEKPKVAKGGSEELIPSSSAEVPARINILKESNWLNDGNTDDQPPDLVEMCTKNYVGKQNEAASSDMEPPKSFIVKKRPVLVAQKSNMNRENSPLISSVVDCDEDLKEAADETMIGVTPNTLEKVRIRRNVLEESLVDGSVSLAKNDFDQSGKTEISCTPFKKIARPVRAPPATAMQEGLKCDSIEAKKLEFGYKCATSCGRKIPRRIPGNAELKLAQERSKLALGTAAEPKKVLKKSKKADPNVTEEVSKLKANTSIENPESFPRSCKDTFDSDEYTIDRSRKNAPQSSISGDPVVEQVSSDSDSDIVGPSPPDTRPNRFHTLYTPGKGISEMARQFDHLSINSLKLKNTNSSEVNSTESNEHVSTKDLSKSARPRRKLM